MIYGVTYGSDNMTISAEKCRLSMGKNGVDRAYKYDADEFKDYEYGEWDAFGRLNKSILEQTRGAGYWLWKPYIICDLMFEDCNDGDILIYSDAGVEFVNSVKYIIDRMDEDIFFFTNGFPQVEWCKMDVLEGILSGYAAIENTISKQVQASVIFFKVNETTRNFVKEWLLWCQMPGFIDDSPSKLPNYHTFAEHRHDQAILTCLQIKYGYKLHWWPTQYSEHIRVPGDTYPVMFNHHRKRNDEWNK